MSLFLLFYQNNYQVNDYFLKDILNFSDYQLETQSKITKWLFPNPDKLSEMDIEIFKTDMNIRKNVLNATSRMLNFFGYKFEKNGVMQIKALIRKKNDIYVGLYSEKNYDTVTRMMLFLNKIHMKLVSALVMLAMCQAMHTDLKIRLKIKRSGKLQDWFNTQKYLKKYTNNYDIDIMGIKQEEEEIIPLENICDFTGLNYTGNSCYQDSTLLALFAIPNDFITKNILEKDLKPISEKKNRDIICSSNTKRDLERRTAIQRELINITKSMRGEIEPSQRVKYCSNLRGLLRKCPSTSGQAFYGTGTQDAGEFLQYLFALFEISGVIRTRRTMVTNDMGDDPQMVKIREIDDVTSPIILIPAMQLMRYNSIRINYFLIQQEDAIFDQSNLYKGPDGRMYRRRIEENIVVKGDYIIFYAQRLYNFGQGEKRSYTEIVPNETIKVGDKKLDLFAIVVHENVHYTCYIKCGEDSWFYYNDLTNLILPVGTYKQMLAEKKYPNPKTKGVLYFYK